MTALWILFSSFCSACILASIQCLRETLAFIDVAFVQFLFVLAVTVVVMLVRKVPFSTHVWHLHLLRSIIGVGVVITQIITAMNMPVAAAQTLQYTSPLFVAGFSAIASFRNGEHIDWRILASITAAFVGILVMFHPSERSFPAVYVPIGLLCGLFTAAAILMLTFFGTSVFGEVSGVEWPAVILCGLCFFVLRKWKVSPILMLAAAGLAGVLLYGLG